MTFVSRLSIIVGIDFCNVYGNGEPNGVHGIIDRFINLSIIPLTSEICLKGPE